MIAIQSKKYCNILVVSTKSVVCNNNCLLISIIHRPIKMMKDVDTCSRQINTLIYRYPVHIYSMHWCDIIYHPYVYSYDVFHHYYNLRHVTTLTTTLVATSYSATFPPTLHHSSFILRSSSLSHLSTQPLTIPLISIRSEVITYSFHSIIISLLLVHFSILSLVVLLLIFFLKRVPYIIIF